MQDMQIVIILLSVIVTILAIMVIVLLGLAVALIVRLRRVVKRVDAVAENVMKVTTWLSPQRFVDAVTSIFSRSK